MAFMASSSTSQVVNVITNKCSPNSYILRNIGGLKLDDFYSISDFFFYIGGILIWLRSHVSKHIKSTIACKMSAYFYFGNSKY